MPFLHRDSLVGSAGQEAGYLLSEEQFLSLSWWHRGPHLCGWPLAVFGTLERPPLPGVQGEGRAGGRPPLTVLLVCLRQMWVVRRDCGPGGG